MMGINHNKFREILTTTVHEKLKKERWEKRIDFLNFNIEIKKMKCPFCEAYECSRYHDLGNHIFMRHKELYFDGEKFVCPVCKVKIVFDTLFGLIQHCRLMRDTLHHAWCYIFTKAPRKRRYVWSFIKYISVITNIKDTLQNSGESEQKKKKQ